MISPIQSVRASKAPVRTLVEDQLPVLRGAFVAKRILQAVPVAVEVVKYGEGDDAVELMSFVFQFGRVRGLMPVHEVGAPIWPLYEGARQFGPGDVASFLALSRKKRDQIKRYMVNLMRANVPLPFEIVSVDNDYEAVVSRVRALKRLSEEIKLSEGQEIEVTVLAAPAHGAWCSHKGLLVFIPRDEVYYGDVAPREMLQPGETYLAKVIEVGDLVCGSTKALEADPWETMMIGEGSVRRAVILGRTSDGAYRVSFHPGVTGKATAPPLLSFHNNQEVMVKVLRVNREKRFILGHIDG